LTFIDFACRLTGGPIPADHGYLLYAALSNVLPALHPPIDPVLREATAKDPPLWLACSIHPIRGTLAGNRSLRLNQDSRLTIRIPSGSLNEVLPLIGRELVLGGGRINVGTPEIRPLVPRPQLYSRLVVIKGATEAPAFAQTARRQLEAMGIQAELGIPYKRAQQRVEGGPTKIQNPEILRRTLRVADKTIVGFAVAVSGLTADESILLQEQGLGGRRRFGCGVFLPGPV
jgi:CRISPR-associated protein Cas6